MQQRKIDHFVYLVPFDAKERVKVIPSGRKTVPEMQVGSGSDATIVPDSEAILHWLDENKGAKLYPVVPDCSEVSVRASDTKLAGLVWYYNWVNDDGFKNSMRKAIKEALIPKSLSWLIPDGVFSLLLGSERTKFREAAAKAIGLEDKSTIDDEEAMRKILVDELLYFQSLLKKDISEQVYMIEGTTQPTAADFSVFAQLERLVGEGTVSDVKIPPAIQPFKEESKKDGIIRLWEWYDHMRATCPIQFKGRSPPKELLERKAN